MRTLSKLSGLSTLYNGVKAYLLSVCELLAEIKEGGAEDVMLQVLSSSALLKLLLIPKLPWLVYEYTRGSLSEPTFHHCNYFERHDRDGFLIIVSGPKDSILSLGGRLKVGFENTF